VPLAQFMEQSAVCDLAYVNLLREKVRQLQAQEQRIATFGSSPNGRFVPYIMPIQSQSQAPSERSQCAE
jgi:hypothetical protein